MDSKEILDNLKSAAARVYVSQRAVKDAAKKEYQFLVQAEESRKVVPGDELSGVVSFHNMTFRKAETGEICSFALHFVDIEKGKRDIFLQKNKLYLWLFAELYERFEDFLEEAYAWAGYCDNDFWPLSDYGGISLSQLSSKNYEWFLNQAHQKKGTPKSITSRFREKLPRLAQVEVENALGINYRLAIELVEQLRHLIVHKGGVAQDRNKFIQMTLEKCGLYNGGKPNAVHVKFVESFFGVDKTANSIVLIELPVKTGNSFDGFFHVDMFDRAAGIIMSYADLLHRCLPAKSVK